MHVLWLHQFFVKISATVVLPNIIVVCVILISDLIMEQVIYVAFIMLCVLAYVTRQLANKREEKRTSGLNQNFKRFEFHSRGIFLNVS